MPEIEILVVTYLKKTKRSTMKITIYEYFVPSIIRSQKIIDFYELYSEIHNINTRFSSDIPTPTANLTTFQKGLFYLESKSFITFLLA
jgi:hypothetical protein